MPITIRVRDFQSIKDTTVIVDGFTAITGGNNLGKSALWRAVVGLFRNTRGASFVRHGAKFCEVKIAFEDGTSVTWRKGKGVNRYRLNEEPWLKKVSHGVPPEIQKVLRIAPVSAGTATFWPQVGRQFDQVFLLDKPGSVLAEAIADVERVGRINKALKLAESDKRKAKTELKVRLKDQKQAQEELEIFEGLEGVGESIQTLDPLWKRAAKTRKGLIVIAEMKAGFEAEESRIASLEGVRNVTVPPQNLFDDAWEAQEEVRSAEGLRDSLNSLGEETEALEALQEQFERVVLGDEAERMAGKTLRSWKVLKDMQRTLNLARSEVSDLERDLEPIDRELETLTEEIEDTLQDFEVCPVCNSAIEKRGHGTSCLENGCSPG